MSSGTQGRTPGTNNTRKTKTKEVPLSGSIGTYLKKNENGEDFLFELAITPKSDRKYVPIHVRNINDWIIEEDSILAKFKLHQQSFFCIMTNNSGKIINPTEAINGETPYTITIGFALGKEGKTRAVEILRDDKTKVFVNKLLYDSGPNVLLENVSAFADTFSKPGIVLGHALNIDNEILKWVKVDIGATNTDTPRDNSAIGLNALGVTTPRDTSPIGLNALGVTTPRVESNTSKSKTLPPIPKLAGIKNRRANGDSDSQLRLTNGDVDREKEDALAALSGPNNENMAEVDLKNKENDFKRRENEAYQNPEIDVQRRLQSGDINLSPPNKGGTTRSARRRKSRKRRRSAKRRRGRGRN